MDIHIRQSNLPGWLPMAAVLAVIAGLLSGCIATIAPASPIVVAGSGNAYAPAMALADDGTKHLAWQECPQGSGCSIVYYRTRMGELLVTQSFAPPAGASNIAPDIALAGDGSAYIVWTTFYSSSSTLNYDAYAVVGADGSASAPAHLDPNAGGMFGFGDLTAGNPRVVARGSAVYGIYSVQGGLLMAGGLYYRQLKPLDVITGTVAADIGCDGFSYTCAMPVSPTAVLDYAGKLHVAYLWSNCFIISCSDTVYQADNTAAANMSSTSLGTSATYTYTEPSPFTAPAIAVAGDNSIFVTFSNSKTATDAVIYGSGTTAASPFVTATVPLSGTFNPWRVEGRVHVTAVDVPSQYGTSHLPVVAFAAKNSATGTRREIWWFSQGDANVTRITNNNGDQNEPLIATMGDTNAGAAIVGWRTWSSGCLRDGYEYDGVNMIVQKVFSSTGGCGSTGQALVANANWASAEWIDYKSQSLRLIPWLAYNANLTFLPLIRR